jgi:glycosyltransferase involved in cell wall biosynthesis
VKILSLTYEYPPIGGGGSIVAAEVNQELVRLGDEVNVLTSAMTGLPTEETVEGVPVHRTACIRRHRHFTTGPELLTTLAPAYRRGVQLMREFRPDVIHTHFILPSGALALALSSRFNVPYVLTAHGSDVPGYNPDRFGLMHWMLKPAWRRIVANAASVTSPSRYLADLLRRQGCEAPISVVPNGHRPHSSLGETRRNRVLVVARMFPRKGIQHFIDAVAGAGGDWEFVIAGDGPFRAQLEAQARAVAPNVQFVGFVNRETLRALYESSKIFVFPSIQENFPMVLLEAMDAGCAIVTTNAEGCAEVVGEAGLVVPIGEPQGIRAALDRLMGDPRLVQDLAARARERAALLTWPNIVGRYREVLQAAVARRAPVITRTIEAPAVSTQQVLR